MAVLAHEMHEILTLRPLLESGGIPIDDLILYTEPGRPGNLHDQAWDIAGRLVDQMRGVLNAMITSLVRMYEKRTITAEHLVAQCIQMIDPDDPGLRISDRPNSILDRMLAYSRRYQPDRMNSTYGNPPATDQVEAARNWIEDLQAMTDQQIVAATPAAGYPIAGVPASSATERRGGTGSLLDRAERESDRLPGVSRRRSRSRCAERVEPMGDRKGRPDRCRA